MIPNLSFHSHFASIIGYLSLHIGSTFFMPSKWRLKTTQKKYVPEFIAEFVPEFAPEFDLNSDLYPGTNSGMNSGMNPGTYFFHVV